MKRSKPTNSSRKAKPPRRKLQTLVELQALQRLMARAVMRPLSNAQRMRAQWSDGRPTKQIAATFIKPNDRLSSFDRLEIYNRQYWLRIIECFYDDYPGLRAVLGENRFRDLAIAYIANHPSASFTLRNLGQYLVDFLQQEPRWTGRQQELAINMARLEWAHIEAFDNETKSPVTMDELLGRKPAKIFLHLQPHITLLQLDYPLDEYLLKLRENTRLRGEASNAVTDVAHDVSKKLKSPKRETVWLAVHRHRNLVYYKRLQPLQYELLLALRSGASLEKALLTLPASRAVPPVQKWFQNWSALGWFF